MPKDASKDSQQSSKSKAAIHGAGLFAKEVTGLSVIQRGVRVQAKYIAQSREYTVGLLKQVRSNFDSGKPREGDPTLDELEQPHLHVLLLNARLSRILLIAILNLSLFSSIAVVSSKGLPPILQMVFSHSLFAWSSIGVSLLATVCVIALIVQRSRDISTIRGILKAPTPPELIQQYLQTFDFMSAIYLLVITLFILYQLIQPTNLFTYIPLAIILLIASVGLYRTFRCIYSPTMPSIRIMQQKPSSFLTAVHNMIVVPVLPYLYVLTGHRLYRHVVDRAPTVQLAKGHYMMLAMNLFLLDLGLLLSNLSVVSIISSILISIAASCYLALFMTTAEARNG